MQNLNTDELESGNIFSEVSMLDAIKNARSMLDEMTSLPIDSLVSCLKSENGQWAIVLDVIEAPARMGDNDLLSSYEINLDAQAAPISFMRIKRYHREDRDQG